MAQSNIYLFVMGIHIYKHIHLSEQYTGNDIYKLRL